MCLRVLEGLGVTAVLNAAQGEMTDWNYVNTKASYYSGKGIRQECNFFWQEGRYEMASGYLDNQ